jgi:hypothetical protein
VRRLARLALLAIVACTGPAPGTDGPSRSEPGSPEPVSELFVRTCESSVYGDLGPRWRQDEVAAGPVVFVAANSYADDPPRRFSAPGDRAIVHKVLIVVLGDASVEVSIDDPHAALAYDEAKWGQRNRMRLEAGDPRVRFEPCPDRRSTQFNGGFLVRGPTCMPVEVQVQEGTPAFATLSFGAGDCS